MRGGSSCSTCPSSGRSVARQARWIRKAGLVWLLIVFSMVLGTASASAPASCVLSAPPDGSILQHAPARIVLAFSSSVNTDFTSIQLIEVSGERYSPTSDQAEQSAPRDVDIGLTT